MPIKVNISISAGGRFKPVSSHTLHEKRITVGRDKECTLTLEDTQKHVSRTHAEFEEKDGAYWLKVVSKVNPVIVNGKRHMFGDRIAMAEGDHISIGLYKLEIVEARLAPPARIEPPKHAEERPEDITYVASRSAFPSGIPSPLSRLPEAPAVNEDATFIRPPKPPALVAPPTKAPPPAAPLPEAAAEAEEATYVPPVKVVPAAPPPPPPPAPTVKTALPDAAFADDEVTYIPPMWARPSSSRTSPADTVSGADDSAAEDMTNFRRPLAEARAPAVEMASPAAEASPPVVEASPPVAEASPPVAEASQAPVVESPDAVDFDLSDAFEEEATTLRPAAVPVPPAPPESEVEEDFSEDLTYVRRPSPMPTRAPAPSTPAPEVPAYSEAERLAEEETHYRSAVPEIGPRVAPGASPAGAGGALQAFLEGAGLSGLSVTDPEKFMRDTGIMVRAAVEGVMMLLLARAEARKELGAEPDSAAGENPLTSMASPAEVIAFLFDPNRPAIGDTDPVLAFGEACGDLRAHQVALLAGMRAAVQGALQRIDPKKIEREHGVNLGGLNLTRKSKLWDISVAQHEQLVRDTEENFSATFGREILAAYAAQLRKMRGGR